jgi:hypothetical protein
MTIICNFVGGFGNHMLNFFTGCILAHKFNKKIRIITNAIEGDKDKQRDDTRRAILKIINYEYITTSIENKNTININNYSDYENLLKLNSVDSNINIACIHLGDMSLYQKNMHIIKNYFILDEETEPYDLVISLRLGMGNSEVCPDVYKTELRLPFDYYKKALDNIEYAQYKKIYICSDNYTDEYLNNFSNYLNELLSTKNTLEQFNVIRKCKCFISSNSTFAIVASLFNENLEHKILFPQFRNGTMFPNELDARYAKILYPYAENNILIII